jgi:hypothetical protein
MRFLKRLDGKQGNGGRNAEMEHFSIQLAAPVIRATVAAGAKKYNLPKCHKENKSKS